MLRRTIDAGVTAMALLDVRRRAASFRNADTLDASLYDRFATKFASMELPQMVQELRGWTERTPASQSVAAMARLLDLSIMSEILSPRERRRAARFAVVLEQILRRTLSGDASALTTIEGAYRLLLHYGEANAPCSEVIDWIGTERQKRGLPDLH